MSRPEFVSRGFALSVSHRATKLAIFGEGFFSNRYYMRNWITIILFGSRVLELDPDMGFE